MKKDFSTLSPVSRVPAIRFVRRLPLCALALFGLMRWSSHNQIDQMRERPHLAPEQIAARALQIGEALGGYAQVVAPPVLEKSTGKTRPGRQAGRFWSTECASNGHTYQAMFNDATGHLCFLINMPQMKKTGEAAAMQFAPLDTPAEALEIAKHRLRDLQLVPAGGQVTLEGTPQRTNEGRAWRVIWKVRTADTPQPYHIRMVLDRFGGAPLMIVNSYEMQSYKA